MNTEGQNNEITVWRIIRADLVVSTILQGCGLMILVLAIPAAVVEYDRYKYGDGISGWYILLPGIPLLAILLAICTWWILKTKQVLARGLKIKGRIIEKITTTYKVRMAEFHFEFQIEGKKYIGKARTPLASPKSAGIAAGDCVTVCVSPTQPKHCFILELY